MSSFKIASRLARVKPSITLAVTAKAKRLKAEGIDIISFGAGEPDFDTPDHIKDAARRGLDTGVAKYTHFQGILGLRQAISSELESVHGVALGPDQIIVSTGAKQSLYNLFQALLDDGDEVIIPAPFWVSYPDMVKLAGGNPVVVPTTAGQGFTMSAEALAGAITKRSRAVVLNTPCNPTGAVYSREQLAAVAEVAAKNDLLIISDDIYRSLVYGDVEYTSIASLSPEIAARTLFIDGVSKTYAMTGWRIGWAAGPAELIKAMAVIQSQSTSGASHIGQVAALAAITGPQQCVADMKVAFDERRRTIVALLNAIPGVECIEPGGAFYAFPNVSSHIGSKTPSGTVLEDDVAIASYLLDQGKVAVVPGTGFGAPGHVRLSYACSMEDINSGLSRIKDAFAMLTPQ